MMIQKYGILRLAEFDIRFTAEANFVLFLDKLYVSRSKHATTSLLSRSDGLNPRDALESLHNRRRNGRNGVVRVEQTLTIKGSLADVVYAIPVTPEQ